MDLSHRNLYVLFAICLALMFMPLWWPYTPLFPLAPFLIASYYQVNYKASLWLSLLCGVVQDLFSAHPLFATHALTYCAATALLYKQKRNFFADRVMTLPLMVYFFSTFSLISFAIIAAGTQMAASPPLSSIYRDIASIPISESFYSLVLFVLPYLLLGQKRRKGEEFFA
jgi:rod shape-determining protein MreD